jgi:thymidylate kinase
MNYIPQNNMRLDIPELKIPYGQELIKNREALISHIREKIQGATLILVDGIPGCGKSTLARYITESLRTNMEGVIHHSLEKHVITSIGSSHRRYLHWSEDIYKKFYTNDTEAAKVINHLLHKEGDITLGKAYSREDQSHHQESIQIPSSQVGQRVMIFDGTGSISHVLPHTEADTIIPIMITAEPNVVLQRSAKRDFKERRIAKRDEWHHKDIKLAAKQRVLPGMIQEGLLWIDNTKEIQADL